jgi:hypothetical protein
MISDDLKVATIMYLGVNKLIVPFTYLVIPDAKPASSHKVEQQ